ncbi:hypothetical protein G9A89_022406 [Geosiphon pyriformis]|nr:hypothetical protein G9A89_022406 [Geosiphon pyriformis]
MTLTLLRKIFQRQNINLQRHIILINKPQRLAYSSTKDKIFEYEKCTPCKHKPKRDECDRLEWCGQCAYNFSQEKIPNYLSNDPIIDNFIKDMQLQSTSRNGFIHWIPFKNFENKEFLGNGGFAEVFSATLNNWPCIGFKKTVVNPFNIDEWSNKSVVLKIMKNGHKISKDYLKQDPDTGNYAMVMKKYKKDYRSYLKNPPRIDSWRERFSKLQYIADRLRSIHDAGYIHCDFHTGNLFYQNYRLGRIGICDFGMCKPANYDSLATNITTIYGVLPYVAPEVLKGQPYTTASDVYSFGIVMNEIASGYAPFHDRNYDASLYHDIIKNGQRPLITKGTPEAIKKLIQDCWHTDPNERPNLKDIVMHLRQLELYQIKDIEIYKQFKVADNWEKLNSRLTGYYFKKERIFSQPIISYPTSYATVNLDNSNLSTNSVPITILLENAKENR